MPRAVNFDFHDTGVLIVGAAAGIGRATALAFARAGARVVAADLTVDGMADLETELKKAGARDALFLPVDVRREDQVEDLVACAANRIGPIGVAINNAGIEGPFGNIHEMEVEQFDRVVAVNLRGVFLGMKHQIGHMLRNGGGVILNTTSTAGVQPLPNVGGYSATKAGIIGLTRAAALEQAANGIRVNAVAPGPVDTGLLERMVAGHIPVSSIASQVPMKRISQPAEIADIFMWLASDAASFVTGEVVMADGGLTIS